MGRGTSGRGLNRRAVRTRQGSSIADAVRRVGRCELANRPECGAYPPGRVVTSDFPRVESDAVVADRAESSLSFESMRRFGRFGPLLSEQCVDHPASRDLRFAERPTTRSSRKTNRWYRLEVTAAHLTFLSFSEGPPCVRLLLLTTMSLHLNQAMSLSADYTAELQEFRIAFQAVAAAVRTRGRPGCPRLASVTVAGIPSEPVDSVQGARSSPEDPRPGTRSAGLIPDACVAARAPRKLSWTECPSGSFSCRPSRSRQP